jgi:hypothetical protein
MYAEKTPSPKTSEPLTTHKKQAIPNNALTVSEFVVVYAIKPCCGSQVQIHYMDWVVSFTTWPL